MEAELRAATSMHIAKDREEIGKVRDRTYLTWTDEGLLRHVVYTPACGKTNPLGTCAGPGSPRSIWGHARKVHDKLPVYSTLLRCSIFVPWRRIASVAVSHRVRHDDLASRTRAPAPHVRRRLGGVTPGGYVSLRRRLVGRSARYADGPACARCDDARNLHSS